MELVVKPSDAGRRPQIDAHVVAPRRCARHRDGFARHRRPQRRGPRLCRAQDCWLAALPFPITTRTCSSPFPHSWRCSGRTPAGCIGFLEHVDLGPTDELWPQNKRGGGGRAREPCRTAAGAASSTAIDRRCPWLLPGHGDVDHRRPTAAEDRAQLGPQLLAQLGVEVLIGSSSRNTLRRRSRARPAATPAGRWRRRDRRAAFAQLTELQQLEHASSRGGWLAASTPRDLHSPAKGCGHAQVGIERVASETPSPT